MRPSVQLARDVAYGRAERAMVNAAAVVAPVLAQATDGVVLVLDIAGMGQLNAQHGLPFGDRVLLAVELALRQQFSANGRVARLPGDQFVVVLPHRMTTDDATLSARLAVAQVRLRGRWRRRIVVKAHIGAARWNDDTSRRKVLSTASVGLKSTLA